MDTKPLWEELSKDLTRDYGLELAAESSEAEGEALLAEKLNALIRSDFNALVVILYRIDVDEARLRYLLGSHPGEDAGKIMARLIIERQAQKIRTRQEFKAADPGSGEERW